MREGRRSPSAARGALQVPQILHFAFRYRRSFIPLLGPVDLSFRALSRRRKLAVRRHKFNKDSLFYLGKEAGGRRQECTRKEGARRVQREKRSSHAQRGPVVLSTQILR